MYCKKCGAQIDEDSVFCQKCGATQKDCGEQNDNDSKGEIQVGTMLYGIKNHINLRSVGCKYKVVKEPQIINGEEFVTVEGPYKDDNTPEKHVIYATVKTSFFSKNPPSQETIVNSKKRKHHAIWIGIFACVLVIIVGSVAVINCGNNSNTSMHDYVVMCAKQEVSKRVSDQQAVFANIKVSGPNSNNEYTVTGRVTYFNNVTRSELTPLFSATIIPDKANGTYIGSAYLY